MAEQQETGIAGAALEATGGHVNRPPGGPATSPGVELPSSGQAKLPDGQQPLSTGGLAEKVNNRTTCGWDTEENKSAQLLFLPSPTS